MSLFGHKQKTVEPDVIPTTVEQAIPIRDVCEDGIFLVGRNLWSKTYRFTDVNYATASKEDKEGMFFAYSEILNTFDAGAMSKITVNNRRLNQTKFRENNMLELQGDSLDKYRNEYNRILAGNANLSNGITQDKYLTVTVEKKTEEEARAYFNRISAEFAALFAKLGSKFEEVTAEEKLRILFDFFHYGAEDDYHYDAGLYGKIMDAFGGENIEISATSKNHINAMDINMDYADGQNPVTLKSEYMLSLCEQAVCDLGPKQKSLIDRCTANLLNGYMRSGFCGKAPTLKDFYEELKAQPEPEAKDIALSLELFTSGSLDTFAGETNVDTKNRLICYDIHDLGRALMPIGMLVVLDNILNRITANKARGRKTYIFIDEIYLLFKHDYSANFLFTLWKRVRKYGAFITGITQNVEDLLQSHTARTMLANSELVVMLNQAATDREELASLMGISDLQMGYITNVDAGHGLVKIGGALVPFVNKVPKDTKLYALMTTKFGE